MMTVCLDEHHGMLWFNIVNHKVKENTRIQLDIEKYINN